MNNNAADLKKEPTDLSATTSQPQTGSWPEEMNFRAFNQHINHSQNWIYESLYDLKSEQIQVKNQRIGLEKLKKIISSTFAISAKQGYHSMSLRQLCTEAGISMGGLYAYINSKDDLATLIESGRAILTDDVINQATAHISDTKARLYATICSHLFLSEMYPSWFYFVFMETRSMAKAQRKTAKKAEIDFEDKLLAIFEQGAAEKRFILVDPYMTATTITAMLQNWYLKRWKYKTRKVKVDDYALSLTKFLDQMVI